jgi:ABC-type phosphate transport system substrate-binding protein
VTGADGKSTPVTLQYAASAASSTPATTRYHTGAADGSTAIDVGNGYMLIGDDENNILRLYQDSVSRAPVKEWNFNSQMGNPEEIDIEASARVGNTIYWTGSMGNSKKGNLKPYRSTLFTTHISGEGAATELTFGGYYKGLRADFIAWDEAHGNRFGFAAGAAAGNIPKQINGFNVEGMEFAPGSTETAYVGFRAPLSPANSSGKALVVPVTNLGALATSGQNTSLHATFGEPILMNLEGLSIREIRKNAAGEYLIIAGSWAGNGPQALYTWDGKPADPPVKALTAIGSAGGEGDDGGAWEGIGQIPNALTSGEELTLVMDVGAANLYGDGVEAKELIPEFQKSPSNTFTLELPVTSVAPESTSAPTISGDAQVGGTLTCATGEWTGTPAPTFAFEWQRDGKAIGGASAANYTAVAADGNEQVRCVVTATNAAGSASANSAAVTIQAAPQNVVAPSVSGNAHSGGTLTCATGEWTGTPAPTYGYGWLRGGDPIAGAEGSSYSVVTGDAGLQIRCVVTGTNSVGSASAPSAPVTIQAANCTGGPITGSGSSLQTAAQQNLWAPGLKAICGSADEVSYQPTSSGAGLGAWGFGGGAFDNSKAFVASDDGPNPTQLAAAKSKAGSSILTIPVAQTAIAIVVNPPAGCTVTEMTNKQLEGVMQGRIKVWSKIETAAGTACIDAPITRVVRKEGSGTTYQVKNYFARINEGTLPCTVGGGQTWKSLEEIGGGADEAPNTQWPENSSTTGCLGQVSALVRAESGAGVVRKVNTTEGSIGYAALPDVEANKDNGENAAGDTDWVKLQNNGVSNKLSVAKFAAPSGAGQSAACFETQYPVPTPAQVGKKEPANADWSQIFGANTNAAATSPDAYPLCSLTYVEALSEYSKAGFAQASEQTVKDYLSNYVLAEAGQEALELGGKFYAPLPSRPASPVFDILGAARFAAARIGY